MKTYKAISLKQPFANWVAEGKKTIETRKWNTKYRGDLVICSSKKPAIDPAGYALCLVELYDTWPMRKEDETGACCKLYDGAYAWLIRNVRPIHPPVPVKGQLSIFDFELPLGYDGVNKNPV
ncbi:MAG: ASCH domain-containing protein [bacterium]